MHGGVQGYFLVATSFLLAFSRSVFCAFWGSFNENSTCSILNVGVNVGVNVDNALNVMPNLVLLLLCVRR